MGHQIDYFGKIPFRPFVSLSVSGPSGSVELKALADTGSVPVVFSLDVADLIEAELSDRNDSGEPYSRIRWRGNEYSRQSAMVALELTDNAETKIRWIAKAFFSDAPISYQLLGQDTALAVLNPKFLDDQRILEIEPTHRCFSDCEGRIE